MARLNLAELPDGETARTDPECAAQRAENLRVLGVTQVLELCVGPSLRTAEEAYARHGIVCWGNDVDPRWRRYHPEGRWVMGDCMWISWYGWDGLVFAPPLSRGCTGRREDSLMVDDVIPAYRGFLGRPYDGVRCLVLPARALSTRRDREQMHRLLAGYEYDMVPLTAGPRRVRKYVDVYLRG